MEVRQVPVVRVRDGRRRVVLSRVRFMQVGQEPVFEINTRDYRTARLLERRGKRGELATTFEVVSDSGLLTFQVWWLRVRFEPIKRKSLLFYSFVGSLRKDVKPVEYA